MVGVHLGLRIVAVAACSAGALGCSWLGGIEEKELTQSSGGGSGGAGVHGYYDLDRPGRPPSRPSDGPKTFVPSRKLYFAMRRLYFGISKRGTSERDRTAWKEIGWDIDGVDTTAQSLANGTHASCSSETHTDWIADGKDGRDNVLGASFLQLVGDADDNGEYATNQGLEAGASTLLLQIEGVSDLHEDPQAPAELLITTHDLVTGPAPKWDGTDVRRISSLSYLGGTTTPIARFPDGYIRGGVWVSGDQHLAELILQVPFYPNAKDPVVMRLEGRHGWLTATIAEGAGGPGTFGYTCTFEEFHDAFFEHIRATLNCGTKTGAENVLNTFASALDTQLVAPWDPDSALQCDTMSWGLDVEWAPVAEPHPEIVETELVEPCP